MSERTTGIVHQETMQLRVSPDRMREFILTPERILDYYPQPVGGGVLEPGKAIYCQGAIGISLLELVEAESNDHCIVLKVTTAIGLDGPCTREAIESNATFTMIEDWELEASASGTTLKKTWRDIRSDGPEPFPLADAVSGGAGAESALLVEAWNQAAQSGG